MGRWHVLYQNPDTARTGSVELDDLLHGRETHSLPEARRRLLARLSGEIKDLKVVRAIGAVPRERFVAPESYHLAYEDTALPIGEGQTISQPLIVAIMTEALELSGSEKVLEVGTGSGYQAAVLSSLARTVISVERKPHLLASARRLLQELGIANVTLQPAGEELGWPAGAPYQAIIVTAASPGIPAGLVEQLDEGGRLVIPAGGKLRQDLIKGVKRGGRLVTESLGACGFVPLIGKDAWES